MKKIMIILGLIFLLFSQGFGADSGAPMRKHNLLDGNWHGDTTRSTPNTNDVIKWDGTKWISGSGTPGGSNTDIQYNNNGTFGGYSFSVDSSLGTSDTTIPSQKAIKTYIDESYFVKQTQTPTALACAIATSPNALALTTGIDYYTLTSDNAACTITGFGLVANGNSFEVGIIATVIIDATGSNIVLKGGRDRIAVNGDTLYCRGRADNKANCTLVSGGVSTDDIATTGTISGGMPQLGTFVAPITTNPYTFAATDLYGKVLYYGATGTINVATLVAGMSGCIYNTGAFTITVNPQDTDVLVIDGTANAAGHYMQIPSGAGNYVCFHADAAGHAVTLGNKGTLVAE